MSVTAPTASRCAVSLTHNGSLVPAIGGSGTVTVTAQRECSWTARAEAAWITLSATQGQGETTLTYSVVSNPDAAMRRANVTIEQQRVEISQEAAPCRYDVSPASVQVAAGGGDLNVTIGTLAGCQWTAQSSSPWNTAEPRQGQGSGTVRITVAPNSGVARNANITIAGVAVAVAQAALSETPAPGPVPPPSPAPPSCTYSIAPLTKVALSAGEQFAITVSAASGCAWTAVSDVSWLTLTQGAAGSGSGTLPVNVAANSGPARSGTLRVAGLTVTVEQQTVPPPAPVCSYSINPTSRSIGADNTDFTVDVRTLTSCSWTAAVNAPWITLLDGATGVGNGTVRLSAIANGGPPRSGTVTIAGLTFTIQQEAQRTCTYDIKPTYYNAGRGPDDVRVNVTTDKECPWSATSSVDWVTITEGQTGIGNGAVRLLVSANAGASRAVELRIAGETFRLTQEGCAASIKPSYYNAGRGPDNIKVDVTASAGCPWTVVSSATWVTVVEGLTGTGTGHVRLKIEANDGAARKTTILIAGESFALTQEGRR